MNIENETVEHETVAPDGAAPALKPDSFMVTWNQEDTGAKFHKLTFEDRAEAQKVAKKTSKEHQNVMLITRKDDGKGKMQIVDRTVYAGGVIDKDATKAEAEKIGGKSAKAKEAEKKAAEKKSAKPAKEAKETNAPRKKKEAPEDLTGDDLIAYNFGVNSIAPRGRVLRRLLKSIGKAVKLSDLAVAGFEGDESDGSMKKAAACVVKLERRIDKRSLPYKIEKAKSEKSDNVTVTLSDA